MILIAGAGIGGLTLGCALARQGRAFRFVERSRRMGRIAHLRSTPLRWLRDTAIGLVPPRLAARALARDLDFRL